MSLVGTLGRMAVGVMVAKGVGKMMSNRQSSGGGRAGNMPSGGLGGMLGGLLGGQGGGGAGGLSGGRSGGLGGTLGSGTGGGLAGGLGSLLGAGSGGRSGSLGNLGAMLGGRSGTAGAAGGLGGGLAGGLGGLLEKISGGGAASAGTSGTASGGSFGDLLNSSLAGESATRPDPGQEEHAKLLIRAMVNAAKSDGKIDEDEQSRIVDHIGDEATAEDREFVLAEMRAPLDVDGFVKSVPRGAEREVYMMSIMGIDLDEEAEARYLDTLRKGIGLSEADVNAIHEQLGVPALYS